MAASVIDRVEEKVSDIFCDDMDWAVEVWLKLSDAYCAAVLSTRSV